MRGDDFEIGGWYPFTEYEWNAKLGKTEQYGPCNKLWGKPKLSKHLNK